MEVGVALGRGVLVAVEVEVAVGVASLTGVLVAVEEGVAVGRGVLVGVAVGRGVLVGVAVGRGVFVEVGVSVERKPSPGAASQPARKSAVKTTNTPNIRPVFIFDHSSMQANEALTCSNAVWNPAWSADCSP